MKIFDFQESTAQRIYQLFKEKGKSRILLSDEVGLGKTIVAQRVIELVKGWHNKEQDDFFKVAYICSNAAVSKQNIGKLGMQRTDQMDIRNSRLSMAHLEISRRQKQANPQKGKMAELIIPLTPATSFGFIYSEGTKEERALMYIHLSRLEKLKPFNNVLSAYMSNGVKHWERIINTYLHLCDECEDHYFEDMNRELMKKLTNENYKRIIDEINEYSPDEYINVEIIYNLRKIFAEVSIAMLQPDLVIMDEFQRFNSLLSSEEKDSEQTYLFRTLLNSKSILNGEYTEPKILLLSATPYKPYSTLEELNIECVDASYSEFMKVIEFLNQNNANFEQFKTKWQAFNKALINTKGEKAKFIAESKKSAEDTLYSIMCRTERFNSGIINDNGVCAVPVSQADILSYAQMQRMIDETNKFKGTGISNKKVPIEYVKSSPYLLSFMENYTLKKELLGYIQKHPSLVNRYRYTLLSTSAISKFADIKPNNAKLEMVYDILFKKQKSHLLLWVPASHPYYKTTGVFTDNARFSKLLVFSAWEMVPRMLSVMLSYYAEQLNVKALCGNKLKQSTMAYNKGNTYGKSRLEKDNILEYSCITLANLYNPSDYMGMDIKFIKKELLEKLRAILHENHIPYNNQKKYSARQILEVMKKLDGEENELESISKNVLNILVDAAIASPAICLYRITKNKETAKSAAKNLSKIFQKAETAILIDSLYTNNAEYYYESVLDYCVKGNLQAVLDEYNFTLSNQTTIEEAISKSILSTSNLDIEDINSIKSKGKNKHKFSMRCNYATPYIDKVITENTEHRITNKQEAFNSPFRPFVLSTTSVGQEGLDFHLYSRKIVHWNLPSNPVDLEQREGRINRFRCLAIRRNVAKIYHHETSWEAIFNKATEDLKGKHSDLVPFWCLPINNLTEEQKDSLEYIERIIPLYPLSRDHVKYQQLIKILSLYRMTLGQPRQEELLGLLSERNLETEQIKELTLNLCPFDKEKESLPDNSL